MSILMNELLKSGYSVRHCGDDEPTCVSVVLNRCPTGPELSMPFKHPCKACAFFPEHLPGSPSHFYWDLHKIWCTFTIHLLDQSWNHIKIHNSNQHFHPVVKILYIDSQDMQVLSSTIASRYYNCWMDGSAIPENYGYRPACSSFNVWDQYHTTAEPLEKL
jgi:hypothetical protein